MTRAAILAPTGVRMACRPLGEWSQGGGLAERPVWLVATLLTMVSCAHRTLTRLSR